MAHTLVGATLSETGLKRTTPLATATLLLGANAPDIDVLAGAWGSDHALYVRRGVTHGVIAMGVLPLVLVGLMLAFDRFVRRRRQPQLPPARAPALLGLALLSTLTHPWLDWLNSYGVRLLMPFDERWFYGDALYIIDPWLWLLCAAAAVLAHTRSALGAGGFILLACSATALVLFTGLVPLVARLCWLAGLAVIVLLRASRGSQGRTRTVAGLCTLGLGLYIAGMVQASRIAERDARAFLRGHGIDVTMVAASLLPADPFSREVIARGGDHYYFVLRRWLGGPALGFNHARIPVGPDDAITRAALRAPQIRGLHTWLRFPALQVRSLPDGHEVEITDVRYVHSGARLGRAIVRLDRALRPR